ncbi:hypothetical protein GTW43_13620 [Streptomyces sp. SID5785]|uniref:acyltransferase domain-containing protein n=1 Tax=Streptomyces sp. SID5785 TaxID=2690309 RepID=UPI001361595B|nr:acyltransferase domain-containing protein [Streptomyces sp. SID5785]MZD06122.1 hypothetical protein [Streptomyces sp. SID5785]
MNAPAEQTPSGGAGPAPPTPPTLDAAARDWAERLVDRYATGRTSLVPVPPGELADRAALSAIPEQDRAELLGTWPAADPRSPLAAALRACLDALHDTGVPAADLDWPDAPASLGAHGRHFYLHVYLAALPRLLEHHCKLGVPEAVTRATVADVGAKAETYRKAHGRSGLDRQRWLVRHFRGTLFRVGRLQYDRTVLDTEACGGTPRHGPEDGERVLELHIPGDGPLTPQLCDTSLREAAAFFRTCFPDETYTYALCRSWLLDPQLDGLLPGTSNILGFQRRFTLFGAADPCDDSVLEFVFHTPPGTADLARLPRSTSLQRAVVTHLGGGGHVRLHCGVLRLP